MSEVTKELCEERHSSTTKEIANIKELVYAIHEGDEKFLEKEVSIIAKELDSIPELRNRVDALEKWKVYMMGATGAVLCIGPFVWKLIEKLIFGG